MYYKVAYANDSSFGAHQLSTLLSRNKKKFPQRTALAVGTEVLAQWEIDKKWYEGTIAAVSQLPITLTRKEATPRTPAQVSQELAVSAVELLSVFLAGGATAFPS